MVQCRANKDEKIDVLFVFQGVRRRHIIARESEIENQGKEQGYTEDIIRVKFVEPTWSY